MSNAEEKAIQYCCTKCENNNLNCGMKLLSNGRNCIECSNYIKGYRQAEKDLTDKAKTSNGWDGFFYGQGYKQAKKDLELTWEDISKIITIDQQVCGTMGISDYTHNHQQAMEEVLRQFKQFKQTLIIC